MTNVNEIWLPINNYHGLYKVSNLGRVKCLERIVDFGTQKRKVKENILVNGNHNMGYKTVVLSFKSRYQTMLVHRLVAESFITNPESKPFINHKDGNKHNNHVENLEWVTRRENEDHAMQNGLKPKGQRNGAAKISDEDAAYIKANYKRGLGKDFSQRFGITVDHILRIVNGSSRNK
jgi:hypothetical protein